MAYLDSGANDCGFLPWRVQDRLKTTGSSDQARALLTQGHCSTSTTPRYSLILATVLGRRSPVRGRGTNENHLRNCTRPAVTPAGFFSLPRQTSSSGALPLPAHVGDQQSRQCLYLLLCSAGCGFSGSRPQPVGRVTKC